MLETDENIYSCSMHVIVPCMQQPPTHILIMNAVEVQPFSEPFSFIQDFLEKGRLHERCPENPIQKVSFSQSRGSRQTAAAMPVPPQVGVCVSAPAAHHVAHGAGLSGVVS
ncbi:MULTISPECIES: hypothetical protein [Pseudomonas syringae group]|uniref:hypothetical protein n=1 Tax=Pseudomonas syringae group TaxID=136849 RepID=UPI001F303C6F|nr:MULTISPECIES: hypothetical protein [Pseudomonas syringae group]